MVASRSAASAVSGLPLPERPTPARLLVEAEAALRGALTESLDRLALCDRNMLRFHYFHGLTVDQLADMFCSSRAVVVRQLARIRERMLRDTQRGLAARIPLDKPEFERLVDLVRRRFDLALTRVLRT
jgi:RNA polymerase sigma-70 factor